MLVTTVLRSDDDRAQLGYRSQLLIERAVAHVLTLQEHVDLAERRPAGLVAVPALAHQIVDLARAQRRLRGADLETVAAVVVIEVVDDLLVGESIEWLLLCERQDLPHGDSKRPNVAFARKLALHK